jgi:hypothetical protein
MRPTFINENRVWDTNALTWVPMEQPGGSGAGDASAANQVTGNTSLASIDGKLPALSAGRIPVELPAGGSGLTDAELRATAVPVSAASLPLPTGASTSAKQDTAQTALDAIKTALETLDNTVSGNEIQADILTAVAADFEHGSNRDVDTAAEQLPNQVAKYGVTIKAARNNTANIYVGKSDVTADTTDATDGFELVPGESLFLPVSNANLIYVIAAAVNQKVFWVAA